MSRPPPLTFLLICFFILLTTLPFAYSAEESTEQEPLQISEKRELQIGEEICNVSPTACLLAEPPVVCAGPECDQNFTILIFPFLALFIGVIAKPFARLSAFIPYTLILLLAGVIIGLLGCRLGLGFLGQSLKQWVHLDPPNAFFFIFLAPLIFEASFNTDYHVFRKLLFPILLAAFAIVVAQMFLIAVFQLYVVKSPEWKSWWPALMFGAMLSATDPISVTATLKSVGASEYLNVMIEGESLVNDGSAFVLWEGFFENSVIQGEIEAGVTDVEPLLSAGDIVIKVLKLSLGGVGLGLLFGLGALIVLTLVYDEFEIETSITIVVAFLGFWTAQSPAKLSGVICNVTSGLLLSALGKNMISTRVKGPMSHVWELLAWTANTIVFVHAGVLVAAFTWSCAGEPHTGKDYWFIIAYYLYLQLIRIGLFLLSYPILSWKQEWMSWKEVLIVGLSGLRGAVSLILALEVGLNPFIQGGIRSRIVLWTTSIVALSLLVNGLIVKPSLALLGLGKADHTKEAFLRRARSLMLQKTLMILDGLCTDQAFKAVRWSHVRDNVLPASWMNIVNTGSYETALSHMQHGQMNIRSVNNEVRRSVDHAALAHRISMGDPLISPPRSPSISMNFTPQWPPRPSPYTPVSGASFNPNGVGLGNDGFSLGRNAQEVSNAKSGEDTGSGGDGNENENVSRLSMYQNSNRTDPNVKRTESHVLREVRSWRKRKDAGELPREGPLEAEVRRRFLTSALSHLRSIARATFVEYSAMLDLEEDLQNALDANDHNRRYDLFEYIERPGWRGTMERLYRAVVETGGSKGETAIVTAHIVVAILTQVLKEPFLKQSPIIFAEVEEEYEWASTLLNRLEAINPEAFSWVQANFAVHLTYRRQDVVLNELLQSGAIDQEEHNVLYEELAEVRRHYSLWTSRRWKRPKLATNESKIRAAPLFSGLNDEEYLALVRGPGKISHMQAGERVPASEGSLVFVLEGAVRAGNCSAFPKSGTSSKRMEPTESRTTGETSDTIHDSDQMSDGEEENSGPIGSPRRSMSFQLDEIRGTRPRLSLSVGYNYTMHWCFPENNSFCGAEVNVGIDFICARELAVLPKTIEFYCCEIASRATIFWLPIKEMKKLIRVDETFRDEVARMIAREIILESVSEQPPYALSHISAVAPQSDDLDTIVTRAIHALGRLPYMTVLKLRAGQRHAVHGPGILLHGTVRVSVIDTSGLVGAANLLHERLTGPALLPVGGLIIDSAEDLDDEGKPVQKEEKEEEKKPANDGDVLAYVLAEQVSDLNRLADLRLKRWTAAGTTVDMNGRFGAYRHTDLEQDKRPNRRASFSMSMRNLISRPVSSRRSKE